MDRRYSGFVRMIFDVSISPMTATRYLAEFDLLGRMLGSHQRVGCFFLGSITTASSCPTHPRVINRFHVSMGLKACT